MSERETIPPGVVEAIHRYHEASEAAVRGYLALIDAARRGDQESAKKIEAGRDDRRTAQDAARAQLDEAVRRWV